MKAKKVLLAVARGQAEAVARGQAEVRLQSREAKPRSERIGGAKKRCRRPDASFHNRKIVRLRLAVAFTFLAVSAALGTLQPTAMPAALRVVTVPILEDNYAYLIVDETSKTCAAVDPAEAQKVVAAAGREGLKLTHVLTTHSHW